MKKNEGYIMKKYILLIAFLVISFPALAQEKESASDRVLRTGTIRCGYVLWSPAIYKDPNTGAISGLIPAIVDAVGKKLELKIEWAEETGWAAITEGLTTGRYDMACTGLYINAPRARRIGYSDPYFYAPLLIAVRTDEQRLKQNADLNSEAFRIAILEGEASSIVARRSFPAARTITLPQGAEFSQLYEEVRTGKADATLIDAASFAEYSKVNPGALRIMDTQPVNIFPVAFGLPQKDIAFKTMIDAALSEIQNDGTMERAMNENEIYRTLFYRVAQPYVAPQE
jgi:ABC-type amino acid transport substrate-binding protein